MKERRKGRREGRRKEGEEKKIIIIINMRQREDQASPQDHLTYTLTHSKASQGRLTYYLAQCLC